MVMVIMLCVGRSLGRRVLLMQLLLLWWELLWLSNKSLLDEKSDDPDWSLGGRDDVSLQIMLQNSLGMVGIFQVGTAGLPPTADDPPGA